MTNVQKSLCETYFVFTPQGEFRKAAPCKRISAQLGDLSKNKSHYARRVCWKVNLFVKLTVLASESVLKADLFLLISDNFQCDTFTFCA
jgi:hypothetical protein